MNDLIEKNFNENHEEKIIYVGKEKILEQIEIYLEKYCQDSDYLAKKINPEWTGREYDVFKTWENYENFINELKSQGLNDEEVKKELERYIRVHTPRYSIEVPEKHDKYDGKIGAIRWEIDKLFDKLELDGTFSNYLRNLIKQKGLTEVEVYKKVNLDRRIFSKLRKDRNYSPSERTIWTIAFSLELNLEETEELLKVGGYAFSKFKKEDLVIKYFFENKIYDLFLINEVLDSYGFKTLGD